MYVLGERQVQVVGVLSIPLGQVLVDGVIGILFGSDTCSFGLVVDPRCSYSLVVGVGSTFVGL